MLGDIARDDDKYNFVLIQLTIIWPLGEWVVAIECFAWLTFNTAKFNTRFKAKGGGRCSRLGVGIRLEEIDTIRGNRFWDFRCCGVKCRGINR